MILAPRPVARFPAASDAGATAALLTSLEAGQVTLAREDLPRLVELLGSDRKGLRRSAAGALATALESGSLDAGSAGPLLAHPDALVRWGAAFAMHRAGLGGAPVQAVALEALASDDGDVRWAASSMLVAATRHDTALVATLRELAACDNRIARKMALLTLAEAGHCDEGTAFRALDDGDALVRIAAITALGRGAAPGRATLDVLAALAARDADGAVRRAAAAVRKRLQQSSATRSLR